MTKKSCSKSHRPLWGALLLCALPFAITVAQEPEASFLLTEEPASGTDTLLCNEDYPECVWIKEDSSRPSASSSGIPFVEPEIESEPGTMMLEWRPVPGFGSAQAPPGVCSRNARALLDKASADFLGSNPNRVLENVDWTGSSSQAADPLIDRMLALMGTEGHWEHQEVVASYGEVDAKQARAARRTLRWVRPDSAQIFVIRERLGCWLLSPSS